ncbi:MFS transporter [Pseudomonas corrugata]|uniref:MFS transporter n=1 Tax=Pseudomonas corrugata TaxID=47879 RepID=A0A7Y5Z182_9PSED|nr:MFS transporter [Pseudomonas corrugata]MCI0997772.1 MFS transporter [Pseudomonas corrugata]NUT66072.1 MFS transporter [Pseudomonas corrugata]NUT85158.1 MFS transporter [Pseudomonas corrugata]
MKMFNPLFFIALGLFGVYTIEFGVVGILPVIIERYSVSASEAGYLVGLFALIIAVFGPFMVLLLSRYNRKRILTLSLFIFAGASALSAYAPNYGSLAVLRIIPAFFHPVYFSLAFVAVASLYPKEQATQATAKAFVGTSMGMVLGVPITTWIAARFSYEAAFLFCTVVNVIAGLGIIARLPDTFAGQRTPYGEQLAILRKPTLWLNILASTLIFGAMFSVYSYSAEYLSREAGMSGEVISALLILFGVGGVAGNLLAGRLLSRNKVGTTLMHPIMLGASYLILHFFASPAILPMVLIIVLWGATHTSGLIVTQVWLTSEAPEAPEFVTGLYISFINLGVTLGATAGGWFLARMGMEGTIISGLVFCALAAATIATKVLVYGARQPGLTPETQAVLH